MLAERGVIQNAERSQQINCFKDLLRQRNITPTDIDGLIDYGAKAFVYLEGKLVGKKATQGQIRALEAVISSHWKAGHPSMALIYEHDIPVTERIPVAFMFVRGIYTKKPIPFLTGLKYKNTDWYFPQSEARKVVTALDNFESHFRVWD